MVFLAKEHILYLLLAQDSEDDSFNMESITRDRYGTTGKGARQLTGAKVIEHATKFKRYDDTTLSFIIGHVIEEIKRGFKDVNGSEHGGKREIPIIGAVDALVSR